MEVCGTISHKMDELIVRKTSSGWNPAFSLFLHTCIYFDWNKMIIFRFVVTMYWTKLLYEFYSNSHLYIYLCVCVCVSFILAYSLVQES